MSDGRDKDGIVKRSIVHIKTPAGEITVIAGVAGDGDASDLAARVAMAAISRDCAGGCRCTRNLCSCSRPGERPSPPTGGAQVRTSEDGSP